MRKLTVLLLLCPALAFAQRREDLLRSPKYVDVKPPHFETFTAEQVRDAVKIYSRRNYAMMGFNDSSVTVRLPAAANSIYATVSFEEPKLTDARGRAVPYEMEQGIFDFDTSSTEIRMTPKNGKTPVEFAHAVGKLTIKYPLAISTKSFRKGSDKYLEIDGPEVSYDKEKIEVPEAASFSKIEPLRAYDASGKQIERADYTKGYFKNNSTWRELGFWGNVAEVRMDSVAKWAEIDVDYDLGPAPKLPASAQGMTPPLEERLKISTDGKVTKTIKAAAAETRPHTEQSGDPHEMIMRVFKGDIDGVRELLDAGASIDSVEASTGSTALIAAVRGGYRDLAAMLIKRGADVNIRDSNGGTALIFAAEKCDWTPLVRELLKRGAQTSPKTKGGANALQFAEWARCSANAALIRGK